MTYSAKDLFQDWYSSSLKKEINTEEISLRKKTIDKLLEIKGVEYWLNLVKLYFDLLPAESNTLKEFVNAFKDDDENFPIQNNLNLIRVLAGCAIAQKIEANTSFVCDTVALAVITTPFLERTGEQPISELYQTALNFWLKECEKGRVIDDVSNTVVKSAKLKTAEIKLPEVEATTNGYVAATHLTVQFNSISTYLDSIVKDVGQVSKAHNSVSDVLDEIKISFRTLSEESNILWWLFGTYSKDLQLPFTKVGFPLMCIISAKELASLTVQEPGIGKIDSIIYKALEATTDEVPSKIAFNTIISSIEPHVSSLSNLVKSLPENLEELLPCLYAIKCYTENDVDEWPVFFKRKGRVQPEKEIEPVSFTKQLYQELMLLRVYQIAVK